MYIHIKPGKWFNLPVRFFDFLPARSRNYLTGLIRISMPLSSAKERQYRHRVKCMR